MYFLQHETRTSSSSSSFFGGKREQEKSIANLFEQASLEETLEATILKPLEKRIPHSVISLAQV